MGRDIRIFGPLLATTQGGAHLSGRMYPRAELGLSQGQVVVSPVIFGQDLHPDDFSKYATAEVVQLGAELRIQLDLCHYSDQILDTCLKESLAGGGNPGFLGGLAGTLGPIGSLMGNNLPLFSSGNHWVSLALQGGKNIVPVQSVTQSPWRFRACQLIGNPVQIPLGVEYTVVRTLWRCIPYSYYPIISGNASQSGSIPGIQVSNPAGGIWVIQEPISSGTVLWDRQLLVDT